MLYTCACVQELVGAPRTVSATVELFTRVVAKLKPTPAKSQYSFNLRDVSRVFQGVTQCNYRTLQRREQVCASVGA